jgi:hypothetical protein
VSSLLDATSLLLRFFPVVLLFELPAYALCWFGAIAQVLASRRARRDDGFLPSVSCIVTCYAEGRDVGLTVRTLLEQTYPGLIEILAVVDGAVQNRATYAAACEWQAIARRYPLRRLKVLPKRTRGGRVSSLNAGRQFARGEIVLALDGDTSFDNVAAPDLDRAGGTVAGGARAPAPRLRAHPAVPALSDAAADQGAARARRRPQRPRAVAPAISKRCSSRPPPAASASVATRRPPPSSSRSTGRLASGGLEAS